MINHQQYDKCGEREMNMMECLEAYGMERGKKKCQDLIQDFQECVGMKKQLMRFHAMRNERHKQYLFGDRKKDDHYAPSPRVDGY
jgi:NADH dehydrogenase (ubiquinone) Fe-S protein 5